MIDPIKVTEVFTDCLFKEAEVLRGIPEVPPIEVNGITLNVGLHPDRVEKHKEDIKAFIDEFPVVFKNGYSFLNMCNTEKGELWTGFHKVMEQLMLLGIASKQMEYCAPRDMWNLFPGNMPYVRTL